MKFKFILALIFVALNCFGAGWSDNYPTYEHPRAMTEVTSNIFFAVRERAYAVGFPDVYTYYTTNYNLGTVINSTYTNWMSGKVSTNMAIGTVESISTNRFPLRKPQFFRSERANLVFLKSFLYSVIIRNVGWGETTDPERMVKFLLVTNDLQLVTTNLALIKPTNISNVLHHVKMPFNYFNFTPQRGLAGLPDSTIETTPELHTYTNKWTIDATTNDYYKHNLPEGRTNFYFCDYGWDGMYDIINLLKYTDVASTRVQTDGSGTARYGDSTLGFLANAENWTWQINGSWTNYLNPVKHGAIDTYFQAASWKSLYTAYTPDLRNSYINEKHGYHYQVLPKISTNVNKYYISVYLTDDFPRKINDEETEASWLASGSWFFEWDDMGMQGIAFELTQYITPTVTNAYTNAFFQGNEFTDLPWPPSDPLTTESDNFSVRGWKETFWRAYIKNEFEYRLDY